MIEREKFSDRIRLLSGGVTIDGQSDSISLTEEQIRDLHIYMEMLLDWNQKMNLTNITETDQVITKHFLDCIAGSHLFCPGASIVDIGTGAGFPGMVLNIVRKDCSFVLMDALKKRLTFLEEVRNQLALPDCALVHTRAEDAGREKCYREQFDAACARAVAPLPVLLEYSIPFVKVGGCFIAYKGPGLEEEIRNSANALKVLGCSVESVHRAAMKPLSCFDQGDPADEGWEHLIAVIRKEKPTHPIYPRKQAKIKNETL